MIELWSGTPGSGKSASVVVYALDFVKRGGVVLSNFALTEDWAAVMAKQSLLSKFSQSYYQRQIDILKNRWWVFGDLNDIWDFSNQYQQYLSKNMQRQYEGKCLLIIDECQLLFNSRSWQKNLQWIEFFSQHRKLGFDVVLIAHSEDMIDSQCRNYIEFIVKLRNLYRVKIPFIQMPFSYLFFARNLFFAKWFYYGVGVLSGDCFKNRLLPLRKWQASLYGSMRIFRFSDRAQSGLRRCYIDPEPSQSPQPPDRLKPLLDAIHSLHDEIFSCKKNISC